MGPRIAGDTRSRRAGRAPGPGGPRAIPCGSGTAERVPVPRSVLGRDVALDPGDAEGAPPGAPGRGRRRPATTIALVHRARSSSGERSPTRSSRSWMPSVPRARNRGSSCCSSASTAVRTSGVEQLAELGVPEQLPELGLVDGQRLRPPLGQRGVSVVDVVGDEAEEQRGGERRGRGCIDRGDPHRAVARPRGACAPAPACRTRRGGTRGRSRAAAGRWGTARRPTAGPPTRFRCCQSGVRAPGRRRGRRSAREAFSRNLAAKSAVDPSSRSTSDSTSSGEGRRCSTSGGPVGVGEADHDAVVGPHRLHVEPQLVAHPGGQGHRPRRVHPASERGENADPPVAQLVAGPLHDQGAVVRDVSGGPGLILEVLQQILRRLLLELVAPDQA